MIGEILYSRMVNEKCVDYAQRLNVYTEIGHALTLEDWRLLKQKNVYFNITFSPGVTSPIEIDIPRGSQLITLDFNTLTNYEPRQRVAILLHEIGHALAPGLVRQEGEFNADDYAIGRGYAEDLLNSLNFAIENYPNEFDKPITRERIQRIQNLGL